MPLINTTFRYNINVCRKCKCPKAVTGLGASLFLRKHIQQCLNSYPAPALRANTHLFVGELA
jgi:hypothetical protein